MPRQRVRSGLAAVTTSAALLLGVVGGAIAAESAATAPSGPGLTAAQAALFTATVKQAISTERSAIADIGRDDLASAEFAIDSSRHELESVAVGLKDDANALLVGSSLSDVVSYAAEDDGTALAALQSSKATPSKRAELAIYLLEAALREKDTVLQGLAHRAGSQSTTGTGQSTQPSAECEAAPARTCTVTASGSTATVDAAGSGTVQVKDERTGKTSTYAVPSEFSIPVDPGDLLVLLDKSNEPASIGGVAATSTGTSPTSEQARSCVDVLRGSTDHVAEVTVTDPGAPNAPAEVTFSAPGFHQTISLTLDTVGEATGSLAVPQEAEIEITVKVTASPTLSPTVETLTAGEDGKTSCAAVATTLPAASTPPESPPTSPPTAVTPPSPPGALGVTIPHNGLSFVGDVCQGGTLDLSVTVLGITAGSVVVIKLSGAGLPSRLTFHANPGQPFGQDFPIRGAGVWSDEVISIAGHPPPSAGAKVTAPWQC
jgi:hypothetical protein